MGGTGTLLNLQYTITQLLRYHALFVLPVVISHNQTFTLCGCLLMFRADYDIIHSKAVFFDLRHLCPGKDFIRICQWYPEFTGCGCKNGPDTLLGHQFGKVKPFKISDPGAFKIPEINNW